MHMAAGNRLRDLRLDKGLSLRAAAESIGIKEWVLRSAEKGRHRPQPRNALLIAQFYDVRTSEIWPASEEDDEEVTREALD